MRNSIMLDLRESSVLLYADAISFSNWSDSTILRADSACTEDLSNRLRMMV